MVLKWCRILSIHNMGAFFKGTPWAVSNRRPKANHQVPVSDSYVETTPYPKMQTGNPARQPTQQVNKPFLFWFLFCFCDEERSLSSERIGPSQSKLNSTRQDISSPDFAPAKVMVLIAQGDHEGKQHKIDCQVWRCTVRTAQSSHLG